MVASGIILTIPVYAWSFWGSIIVISVNYAFWVSQFFKTTSLFAFYIYGCCCSETVSIIQIPLSSILQFIFFIYNHIHPQFIFKMLGNGTWKMKHTENTLGHISNCIFSSNLSSENVSEYVNIRAHCTMFKLMLRYLFSFLIYTK